METDQKNTEQRRDAILLHALKTPPQPRPKRERNKKLTAKKQPKKIAPAK